jgi:hypothetical protein
VHILLGISKKMITFAKVHKLSPHARRASSDLFWCPNLSDSVYMDQAADTKS